MTTAALSKTWDITNQQAISLRELTLISFIADRGEVTAKQIAEWLGKDVERARTSLNILRNKECLEVRTTLPNRSRWRLSQRGKDIVEQLDRIY